MVSDLEPRITVCRVWGWTVWSSGFGLGPQHSVFTVLTYTDWVLSVDILDFSGRFGSEGKGREAVQIRIPMCRMFRTSSPTRCLAKVHADRHRGRRETGPHSRCRYLQRKPEGTQVAGCLARLMIQFLHYLQDPKLWE